MIIETKYNHGDMVYPIWYRNEKIKIPKNCPTCKDKGSVEISGKSYRCPECNGFTYHTKEGDIEWYVEEKYKSKIGKITVELYKKETRWNKNEYTYMLDSTGVGSGMNYNEEDLFLSVEEAQSECDKRNEEIRNK